MMKKNGDREDGDYGVKDNDGEMINMIVMMAMMIKILVIKVMDGNCSSLNGIIDI